jgi:ketosteroid isomerase-like protein
MSADEKAIRTILENHQRWYNAGDWKSIRSEFADDIVVMPDFTTTVVGADQLEQWFRENFQALAAAGATQTMDARLDEVRVFGDWAFDRGTFDITTRKGEKSRTFHIRFVELFKKQADGSWKIVRGMNNYTEPPFPPAPPAPEKQAK